MKKRPWKYFVPIIALMNSLYRQAGSGIKEAFSPSGFSESTLNHVLNGDAYGGIHFMHSTSNNFKITDNILPADANSVSKYKILSNGTEKPSSLFPPSYTADEIGQAAKVAFTNKIRTARQGIDMGYDSKGVPIVFEYNNSGAVQAFYPVHSQDMGYYIKKN